MRTIPGKLRTRISPITTPGEIFEHDGVTGYTGDLRTLFQIRNAKDAYELFLCAFGDRRPLDEAFLKELQLCLTKNTYGAKRWRLGKRPGEYKRHNYVTGREEIGAATEDVADEVRELLEELPHTTAEDGVRCYQLTWEEFDRLLDSLAERDIVPEEQEDAPEAEGLSEGYDLVYVTEE